MTVKRVPIFKESDLAAKTTPGTIPVQESKPKEITVNEILYFKPAVQLNFSPERLPYNALWKEYGLTVKGKHIQTFAGFNESNYTKARRGQMHITAAQLIAASLLSKVTVQQAFDIFHYCSDTDELIKYGNEAAVLAYLLNDMQESGTFHGYDELIWWTLKLNDHTGIVGIPKIHSRHRKWAEMRRRIDDDRITIAAVIRRQNAAV